MTSVLGVTLARAGSKGVPGKNTKLLNGAPLLSYTTREALKSKSLTDYIVSTDDKEIQKLAVSLGASAPFIRPSRLATDVSSSVSALQHAVNWMESRRGSPYDVIVEIMNTNPLKTAADIDNCVDLIINSGADSVIAVNLVEDNHPARIKKIESGRIVDFCCPEPQEARRQDLTPKAYVRSGSIYALTRKELMENGRRYGSEFSVPYILPESRVINIDTELDWIAAEVMLSRLESS